MNSSTSLRRHRLWHGAWALYVAAGAIAAHATFESPPPAESGLGVATCVAASVALGAAAILLRARLLSPAWLRRGTPDSLAGTDASHSEACGRGTRELARLWGSLAALACVGACAAHVGAAWLAAGDAAIAAVILLTSSPKLLADSL